METNKLLEKTGRIERALSDELSKSGTITVSPEVTELLKELDEAQRVKMGHPTKSFERHVIEPRPVSQGYQTDSVRITTQGQTRVPFSRSGEQFNTVYVGEELDGARDTVWSKHGIDKIIDRLDEYVRFGGPDLAKYIKERLQKVITRESAVIKPKVERAVGASKNSLKTQTKTAE